MYLGGCAPVRRAQLVHLDEEGVAGELLGGGGGEVGLGEDGTSTLITAGGERREGEGGGGGEGECWGRSHKEDQKGGNEGRRGGGRDWCVFCCVL